MSPQRNAPDLDLEEIRSSYRPASGELRVLFVGESPPRGRGFFYAADSTLFRCMVPVLVEECGFPEEPEAFLERFREGGFYIEDFSHVRGDKPAKNPDGPEARAGVERIAELIGDEEPEVVVGVLSGKAFQGLLEEAVAASSRPETSWRCLRFPYHRDPDAQDAFKYQLTRAIRDFDLGARS